jgi:hypothetical protein
LKNSAFNGDKSLQIAIERYIIANAKITEEEAGKIFNIEWNKIVSEN